MSGGEQPAPIPPLRVLIVDDHPVFREGLRAVIAYAPGLELAGEAASGEDAVQAAAERHPDVVVMDL
ncbi:MAG: response regulator transcription factor, partial [Candidatus Dormibacteria bacterium]